MKYLIILLFSIPCFADEIGLRYGGGSHTESHNELHSPIITPFDGGKFLEVTYKKPISSLFYVEGATGVFCDSDFGTITSPIFEVSIGVQIKSDSLVARVSQGVSLIPGATTKSTGGLLPSSTNGVTHVFIGFYNKEETASVGLDFSHYSNGSADKSNIGATFTGISVSLKLGESK